MAEPSEWVRRFAHLVPGGGTVLDLAAGGGRHARFSHGLGHPVVAVDRSLAGIADLAGVSGVELVEADIETDAWPLAERCFAGIVVTNYLYRPLLPRLAASLEDGGVLIYETFAIGQAEFGRPTNPDFLLRPHELIDVFRPLLSIVAYEQGIVATPRPAVIQRIVAVARTAPVGLQG